ncbi:MAG: hypothetical protein Q4D91_04250 [Lautropia sp.]|nr:hypothetical protein [Lautropia sp.]
MRQTRHDTETPVGRERVRLVLIQSADGWVIERTLIQADGSRFVHSVLIDSPAMLFEYMVADPYFTQLEPHYTNIQQLVVQQPWLPETNLAGGYGMV